MVFQYSPIMESHRCADRLVRTQQGVRSIQVTWLSIITQFHLSLENLRFLNVVSDVSKINQDIEGNLHRLSQGKCTRLPCLCFWLVVWVRSAVIDIAVHSLFSVRFIPHCQHCFWRSVAVSSAGRCVCDDTVPCRCHTPRWAMPQGAATVALCLVMWLKAAGRGEGLGNFSKLPEWFLFLEFCDLHQEPPGCWDVVSAA